MPGAASGRTRPERAYIDGIPEISGELRAGALLTASAEWGPGDARAEWRWLRCPVTDDLDSCRSIAGADASTYRVADADVGRHLRVLLTVTTSDGDSTAWEYSFATDTIRARPAPAPTPTPPPPVVTPTPTPVAVVPTPVPLTPPPAHHRARMMHPRPIVRIKGWLTPTGARVTLLTVRAPRGARVRVRCRGRGCPRHRWAHTAVLVHAVPFERRLRAGTRLVITVTKRGFIGKYTVLRLRRGKPPARKDRCLYPGSSRPRRCPAT